MREKRLVEIFSAGCACCEHAVQTIRDIACPSCEVNVLDMNIPEIADLAKFLGIKSVPAVVIDGKLVHPSASQGIDEEALRAAGLGRAL